MTFCQYMEKCLLYMAAYSIGTYTLGTCKLSQTVFSLTVLEHAVPSLQNLGTWIIVCCCLLRQGCTPGDTTRCWLSQFCNSSEWGACTIWCRFHPDRTRIRSLHICHEICSGWNSRIPNIETANKDYKINNVHAQDVQGHVSVRKYAYGRALTGEKGLYLWKYIHDMIIYL